MGKIVSPPNARQLPILPFLTAKFEYHRRLRWRCSSGGANRVANRIPASLAMTFRRKVAQTIALIFEEAICTCLDSKRSITIQKYSLKEKSRLPGPLNLF